MRSWNSSPCQQELWITLQHRPQGFGVKALLVFWKVAVSSVRSCSVRLQRVHTLPAEGTHPLWRGLHCFQRGSARNQGPELVLGDTAFHCQVTCSDPDSLGQKWLKAGTRWRAVGYPVPRVANCSASGQVLVVSQSSNADQIKDEGEYEAVNELKCFNFRAN